MPIAASAIGACLTGVAGGMIALSTAQSRLPAILAWLLKPEPDLDGKVVLVCTGHLPQSSTPPRSHDADPAVSWRRVMESEHGAVVMIDVRLPSNAGEKQRVAAEELARRLPADFRRDFPGHDDRGEVGWEPGTGHERRGSEVGQPA